MDPPYHGKTYLKNGIENHKQHKFESRMPEQFNACKVIISLKRGVQLLLKITINQDCFYFVIIYTKIFG